MNDKIPTSVEFLDRLRVKLGTEAKPVSDYRVSQVLGITRAAVSQIRQQRTTWGHPTIETVASILEVDPLWAVACVDAERAQNVGLRRIRLAMVKKLAVSVLGFVLLGGMMPRPAAAGVQQLPHNASFVYYVN
jgi:hypothetical protein